MELFGKLTEILFVGASLGGIDATSKLLSVDSEIIFLELLDVLLDIISLVFCCKHFQLFSDNVEI